MEITKIIDHHFFFVLCSIPQNRVTQKYRHFAFLFRCSVRMWHVLFQTVLFVYILFI